MMKYFTPIHVQALDRIVWLNPYTFEHTAKNLDKMSNGKAPLGVDGKNVNLHHMGRRHSGSLATLTDTFHRRHYSKIHSIEPPLEDKINRKRFDREKKKVWKAVAQWLTS